MTVLWGPCADGRFIVTVDGHVIEESISADHARGRALEIAGPGGVVHREFFVAAGSVQRVRKPLPRDVVVAGVETVVPHAGEEDR